MNILEIIRLRTERQHREQLVERLRESISEDQATSQTIGTPSWIRIYCNATIESDLCVLVELDLPGPPTGLSPVGLRLASALSEYGVVEHSVWSLDRIETESDTGP